jgi:hypothetical protein
MPKQAHEIKDFYVGDKVRFREGQLKGEKGIVAEVTEATLKVLLSNAQIATASPSDLTNYSLAARRAWEIMPKRAGRPQSTSVRKKMVSMRLDSGVWADLGRAVALGLIQSREQAINNWLRDIVCELFERGVERPAGVEASAPLDEQGG